MVFALGEEECEFRITPRRARRITVNWCVRGTKWIVGALILGGGFRVGVAVLPGDFMSRCVTGTGKRFMGMCLFLLHRIRSTTSSLDVSVVTSCLGGARGSILHTFHC